MSNIQSFAALLALSFALIGDSLVAQKLTKTDGKRIETGDHPKSSALIRPLPEFKAVPEQRPNRNSDLEGSQPLVIPASRIPSNANVGKVQLASNQQAGKPLSPVDPLNIQESLPGNPLVPASARPKSFQFPRIASLPGSPANQDMPPIVSSPVFRDEVQRTLPPITQSGRNATLPNTVPPVVQKKNTRSAPANSNQNMDRRPPLASNHGTPIRNGMAWRERMTSNNPQVQNQSNFPLSVEKSNRRSAVIKNDFAPLPSNPGRFDSQIQIKTNHPPLISRPAADVNFAEGQMTKTESKGDGIPTRNPRVALLNRKNRLTSFFKQDSVELGKDLPKFSGLSELDESGSVVMDTMGGRNDCGQCDSPRCQYDVNSVSEAFGSCGYIARARRIYRAEALYGFMDSDTANGSSALGSSAFDGVFGGRFTAIAKEGVWGNEVSYTGFETWTAGTQGNFPAAFGVSGFFTPPLAGIQAVPFNNATFQSQSFKARFHTAEFNRSYWFWDVAKTHFGIRYMFFQDEYSLISFNGANGGTYNMEATNHILGPQIGIELFYDVGQRLRLPSVAKLAEPLTLMNPR